MVIIVSFLAQLALFAIGLLGPWRDAPERKTNGRLPLAVCMLLSLSLVIAAFIIWQSGAQQTAYAQWVCFGMFASFIGDLIMAQLIPLPNRLIGGMIAFGIAHALYITAYISTIGQSLDSALVGLFTGLLFYCSLTVLTWWFLIRNPQKETAINIGALVYGLWISVMASFAFALAVAMGGARFAWFTAIGGLIFVVSDFLIGITDIRGIAIKNANDWIWLTYIAGQMGIVYAGWVAV